MSKAEDLLGIKYTEMNKQQRRLYWKKLKEESRKRNSDKIKEQNKRYYENKKSQFSDLQSQLDQQKVRIKELEKELKEKDKKIKELESENKVGEFWHSAYQGKQLDYDMVYYELRKAMDENQQLKQSQNQKAVKVLERLRKKFEPYYLGPKQFCLTGEVMREIDIQISEIKELKGEQ